MLQTWYWVNTGDAPIVAHPVMMFLAPKDEDPAAIVAAYFYNAQCDPAPYLPFVFHTDVHDAFDAYDRVHPGRKTGQPGVWVIWYPEMAAAGGSE